MCNWRSLRHDRKAQTEVVMAVIIAPNAGQRRHRHSEKDVEGSRTYPGIRKRNCGLTRIHVEDVPKGGCLEAVKVAIVLRR